MSHIEHYSKWEESFWKEVEQDVPDDARVAFAVANYKQHFPGRIVGLITELMEELLVLLEGEDDKQDS